MRPITVVGSYNTGLTMAVDRIPMTGETVMGSGYSEGPGGKGSNQAVAAARLGGEVALVCCIGRDRFGASALGLWRREKVDSSMVRLARTHTGLGFVMVDREGNNVISIDPGANLELARSDVDRARSLISKTGVLLLQLEIRPEIAMYAARMGKEGGATVILNPAPAPRPRSFDLAWVDILTPNETEFRQMAGTSNVVEGSRKLLAMGPSAVVITRGEMGATVVTRDRRFSVPGLKVKVADTTGAGDAFNGALAVALAESRPLEEAAEFANCAGALCVTRKQVIPSLPRRRAVDALLRRSRSA